MPLPETVKDALLRLPNDMSYVSHSVKVEGEQEAHKKSEFTSENHAFYLGKIIPDSFGDKARKLLGWGGEDGHIYTPEVIKGMLDYAFQHVKDDEKVRLVIGSSLSELFNGPEDMENVLTLEKQRELIQKIAKKQFHKDENSLEIISFDEDMAHTLLYQVLRENIDKETGVVDVPKALGSIGTEIQDYHEVASRIDAHKPIRDLVKISPEAFFEAYDPSSLRFAAILYRAFEEDDRFRGAIENTIPARIKESDSPSASYYGLIEIAMRLSDIIRGRFVHGGVERQEVYDQIITKIVKGRDGGYKNIKALEPLFDLFEGKRFETVHLKTKKNHYELKKKRTLARSRLLLTAVLGGSTIAGAFGLGQYSEMKKQEKRKELVDKDLRESLVSVNFFMDGKFKINTSDNVNIFHNITDEVIEDIGRRYDLSSSPEVLENMRPFLQEFLVENRFDLNSIYGGNKFTRIDLEDSFIRKYALYFKNRGIEIKRPYENLMPYASVFRDTLNSDEDIVIDDKFVYEISNERRSKKDKFTHMGTFYCAESDLGEDKGYEFYWYTDDNGKRHLVAKEDESTYNRFIPLGPASHDKEEKYNIYSTREAKKGIRQFFYAMRRFDAIGLIEHQSLFNDLVNLRYDENDPKGNPPCSGMSENIEKGQYGAWRVNTYEDSFGKFKYEFFVQRDFDPDTRKGQDCVLAKKPGQKEFTIETGMEMIRIARDVDKAWYDYHNGFYVEEFMPMDFNAINQEMESMLCFLDGLGNTIEENKELKEGIDSIRNLSAAATEDIQQYDGSYESSRSILTTLEYMKEDFGKLMDIINETTFIDECTQEPVSSSEIIKDAAINTRLNLIFQARNALMEMKITWPKTGEKVS